MDRSGQSTTDATSSVLHPAWQGRASEDDGAGRVADELTASSLGRAILARRRELGLTQEQLAQRVVEAGDVAFRQSDVSRLESGRVTLPRRDRLERLARALGLAPGELLVRSGWAGADALRPLEFEVGSDPLRSSGLTPGSPAAPRRASARDPRLREAITRAEQTRARSEELLRRCRELWGAPAGAEGWGPTESAG